MKKRTIVGMLGAALAAVMLVGGFVAPPYANSEEIDTTGGWAYEQVGNAKYQLMWIKGQGAQGTLATEVPPTYTEGQPAGFSFDLNGNARFTLGTCISGESDCAVLAPNKYLMIHGATIRDILGATGITTNTTSAIFTIPTGAKTPRAKVEGTGAVTATLKLYGSYDTSTTVADAVLLCTATLSGTTKKAGPCDSGAQFTQDFPNYFIVSSNVTGTGASAEMIIGTGIAASSASAGGAGDASAANQTTMIGHLDGVEGTLTTIDADTGAIAEGIGASTDAAATVGSVGSINAKLRYITTKLSDMHTVLQLIDDDQTGSTMHHRISAGSTEDEHEIKATAGRLFWINVTNTNAAVRYLRCANLTAANTTPGSSTVWYGMAIPGDTTGAGYTTNFGPNGVAFTTALTCWIVTGAAESDVAEVAANEINVNYGFK